MAAVADAVVVAAGRSERMRGLDKLASDLGGRPVLAWSLEAIAASPLVERVVLVVRPDAAGARTPSWLPAKVVATVPGGDRRQDSVRAGIDALVPAGEDRERVLLVHDGARPFVTPALVTSVVRAAVAHGAAIPVLPVVETLKRVEGDLVAGTLDRSGVVAAQTPQAIRWDVLREALGRIDTDGALELTDEAALLEAAGIAVHVVPGEPANLKITRPEDLDIAAARLSPAGTTRTGFGADLHPFGPGAGLRLGGIEIAGAARLHGHSDGDVALHAIAGALLGATALGDLGGLHPADARTPRGIASAELLRGVVASLAEHRWRPAAVDVQIRAARPSLAAHLPAMRQAIADLLDLDAAAVSVKASSGNLSGDAGAGRVVEAEAIATVVRTEAGS